MIMIIDIQRLERNCLYRGTANKNLSPNTTTILYAVSVVGSRFTWRRAHLVQCLLLICVLFYMNSLFYTRTKTRRKTKGEEDTVPSRQGECPSWTSAWYLQEPGTQTPLRPCLPRQRRTTRRAVHRLLPWDRQEIVATSRCSTRCSTALVGKTIFVHATPYPQAVLGRRRLCSFLPVVYIYLFVDAATWRYVIYTQHQLGSSTAETKCIGIYILLHSNARAYG